MPIAFRPSASTALVVGTLTMIIKYFMSLTACSQAPLSIRASSHDLFMKYLGLYELDETSRTTVAILEKLFSFRKRPAFLCPDLCNFFDSSEFCGARLCLAICPARSLLQQRTTFHIRLLLIWKYNAVNVFAPKCWVFGGCSRPYFYGCHFLMTRLVT